MYLRGPISAKLPERMEGTNCRTADSTAASEILSPPTSYTRIINANQKNENQHIKGHDLVCLTCAQHRHNHALQTINHKPGEREREKKRKEKPNGR